VKINIYFSLLFEWLRLRPEHAGGFEHGDFTLKHIKCIFVHAKSEKFKNATITGCFGKSRVRKSPFSLMMFSVDSSQNPKAGVFNFKFLQIKHAFRKAFRKSPFS